jgi:hypothetical protein
MAAWSLRETTENAVIKECAAICRCGAMGSAAIMALDWTRMVASTLRNDSEFNPISRSAGEAKRLSQRVSHVACCASASRRHRASAPCREPTTRARNFVSSGNVWRKP